MALVAVRPPPVVFCPLLKKFKGNPYLKILDFSQLLLRMPLWKKNSKNLVYPHAEQFWDTQYKSIFYFFALIKKIFLETLVEIIIGDH